MVAMVLVLLINSRPKIASPCCTTGRILEELELSASGLVTTVSGKQIKEPE